MQAREKKLVVGVGILAGVMGLRWAYGLVEEAIDSRQKRLDSVQAELNRKEDTVFKGSQAGRKIAEFEARALPPQRELARSLYQNWLVGLIADAKLSGEVVSQKPQKRGIYEQHSFVVSAKGTLQEATRFLHAFYASGHLHQIRRLSLAPVAGGKDFDISVAIEALSLPGSANVAQLSKGQPGPMADKSLAEIEKTIVDRNLFAAYTPPKKVEPPKPTTVAEAPKPTPKPPAFDAAKHTMVSSILSAGEGWQVWLNDRTTGKLLRLAEGEQFKIGSMSGTVLRITPRNVEVESDGRRVLLSLGENLREGVAVTDGEL